jgi:hypothetical protein
MRISLPIAAVSLLLLGGCASIPKEAPELSAQLGTRLTAMATAHRHLVTSFFNEKRRQVDEAIQQTWAPLLARNTFEKPNVASAWQNIIESKDVNERLRFIIEVSSALQAKINAKRLELMRPLDQLEREIGLRLQAEYDQMRAVNDTLTHFLQSAAKADANRQRLLALAGVSDQKISAALGAADQAVNSLLLGAQEIKGAEQQAESFQTSVHQIIGNLQK